MITQFIYIYLRLTVSRQVSLKRRLDPTFPFLENVIKWLFIDIKNDKNNES